MDAIKSEVLQLSDQMVTIGNSQFNGKYVFNGQLTDVEPYSKLTKEQAANTPYTQGYAAGAVDVSVANVSAADNELQFVLDGKANTVTIPPGSYNSSTLANAVQTEINKVVGPNADGTNDATVSVGTGNVLKITSSSKGMNSTVVIKDSTFATTWMSTLPFLSDIVTTSGTDGGRYSIEAKRNDTDKADINFEITTGIKLPVNITGDEPFGKSSDKDNVFGVLNELANALDQGDSSKVSDLIGKFDSRLNKFLEVRSVVGARSNRVDLSLERTKDININLQELQSKTEDVDMAELITNMKTNENIYNASLSVGSKIITPSLVDFLK
jgi:flagellin-like hook-associated protein FlgL